MTTELLVIVFPVQSDWLKEGESWLDDDERERLGRMTNETIRSRFIACRSVLRQQLAVAMNCREAQVKFTYGAAGKPMVAGCPKSFNISHAGDYGIVALSNAAAIGVDVESMRPKRNLAGIGRHVFHPDELNALARVEGDQKTQLFYNIWVRKEAVTKMLGDSVFQVRDISVMESVGSPALLSVRKRGFSWILPVKVSSRYAAALAIAVAPEAVCPHVTQRMVTL